MNRRFTILIHDHPFPHWDLLVENGESLLAWRLLEEPDQPHPILCEPLPDHRRIYLDYEGPVSRNRGVVRQWTTGTCTLNREREELYRLELDSPRWRGNCCIRREAEQAWYCYPPGAALGAGESRTGASD